MILAFVAETLIKFRGRKRGARKKAKFAAGDLALREKNGKCVSKGNRREMNDGKLLGGWFQCFPKIQTEA
jgi:hypothetical protein